ncbi:hypothetical protein [Achromobacter aloeverae]
MTTDTHNSFVHFHSSYLFDLARDEQKNGRGVPCVIMCVAAIEALPSDIALSLRARQEFEQFTRDGLNRTQKRDILGRVKPEFFVSRIEPLSPMEESFADTIKKLTGQKRSGLDQYYVLDGLLRSETRDPIDSKDKKATWKATLPVGVNDLFELRNAIIHRGGSEFLYDNGGTLVNESSALPSPLIALKKVLGVDYAGSRRAGWLGLIDTPTLASWGLDVTKRFVNSTLQKLPNEPGFRYLKNTATL